MRRAMFCVVISLVTLVGTTTFAQGQERPSRRSAKTKSSAVQVGVTGLLNLSTQTLTGNGSEMASELIGYTQGFGGGLRVIYEFGSGVGIQPEILFKQYGASMEAMSIKSSTTMNYLEVPILMRYSFPFVSGVIKPKVLAGPTIGYFLSGSGKVAGNTVDFDEDGIEKLSIGVAGGVGADILLGSGSLSIDLRYDRSLTELYDTSDIGSSIQSYNTGFGVMLGYNQAF